jgi:hypothetical protein
MKEVERDHSDALLDHRKFLAVMKDKTKNDNTYSAKIRGLTTALEFDAYQQLKSDYNLKQDFARHRIVDKLIIEGGVQKEIAQEAVSCWAMVVGFNEFSHVMAELTEGDEDKNFYEVPTSRSIQEMNEVPLVKENHLQEQNRQKNFVSLRKGSPTNVPKQSQATQGQTQAPQGQVPVAQRQVQVAQKRRVVMWAAALILLSVIAAATIHNILNNDMPEPGSFVSMLPPPPPPPPPPTSAWNRLNVDLIPSGRIPENPTELFIMMEGADVIFYYAPAIIYTTTGEENGLGRRGTTSGTHMFVKGVVYSFGLSGSDNETVFIESYDGLIQLIKSGQGNEYEWNMLEVGSEYGFFFRYMGLSIIHDIPAGWFLNIEIDSQTTGLDSMQPETKSIETSILNVNVTGMLRGFVGDIEMPDGRIISVLPAGTYTVLVSDFATVYFTNSTAEIERYNLMMQPAESNMAWLEHEAIVTIYDGDIFVFQTLNDSAIISFLPIES